MQPSTSALMQLIMMHGFAKGRDGMASLQARVVRKETVSEQACKPLLLWPQQVANPCNFDLPLVQAFKNRVFHVICRMEKYSQQQTRRERTKKLTEPDSFKNRFLGSQNQVERKICHPRSKCKLPQILTCNQRCQRLAISFPAKHPKLALNQDCKQGSSHLHGYTESDQQRSLGRKKGV